ncbi:hypothetical protein WOLCODRAFT_165572 [Wolfiporia cocos MD-104 SS10]|uniref:Uncharacterized protein n=1 Tax=Wolfiporia cocos (strain MD-104) TaxID=742152 RepID=A0A2H3JU03_WOLCO|nr:hypothetical protein WOLCODRAFT_165572 [Wolfiporia cocos MD-104 SS10]
MAVHVYAAPWFHEGQQDPNDVSSDLPGAKLAATTHKRKSVEEPLLAAQHSLGGASRIEGGCLGPGLSRWPSAVSIGEAAIGVVALRSGSAETSRYVAAGKAGVFDSSD